MTTTIDLRSDTVTWPTPAMRAAMAAAEVGDDMFAEDPTVIHLQETFAERAGKEAALFTPSGTMANQIAIKCHTSPGDEVICDANSHIIHYETAAPAAISGVSIRPIGGRPDGQFAPEEVCTAIRPDNINAPRSALVLIENTHNRGGGSIWPLAQVQAIADEARHHSLALHLDGARISNAVVATGIPLAEWAKPFDTLTCCFSKGLGAPVGTVLCGPAEFIGRARRIRKMLGGAMRQSGVLAAAALHALEHHWDRLAEDHANARLLAAELAKSAAIVVEGIPETNMVYIRLANPVGKPSRHADDYTRRCRERGVLFFHVGAGRIRLVTHLDVRAEQVVAAAKVMRDEAER